MEQTTKQKSITLELMGISNQLRRNADAITALHGGEKFSGMHCFILSFIYDQRAKGHEVYQRDVEKEFYISRSTASGILGLMEKKGLISRCSVPQDARLKKLVPTQRAEELITSIRADLDNMNAILDDSLTPQEKQQLHSLLVKLWQMMDEISRSVGIAPLDRRQSPEPYLPQASEQARDASTRE